MITILFSPTNLAEFVVAPRNAVLEKQFGLRDDVAVLAFVLRNAVAVLHINDLVKQFVAAKLR